MDNSDRKVICLTKPTDNKKVDLTKPTDSRKVDLTKSTDTIDYIIKDGEKYPKIKTKRDNNEGVGFFDSVVVSDSINYEVRDGEKYPELAKKQGTDTNIDKVSKVDLSRDMGDYVRSIFCMLTILICSLILRNIPPEFFVNTLFQVTPTTEDLQNIDTFIEVSSMVTDFCSTALMVLTVISICSSLLKMFSLMSNNNGIIKMIEKIFGIKL